LTIGVSPVAVGRTTGAAAARIRTRTAGISVPSWPIASRPSAKRTSDVRSRKRSGTFSRGAARPPAL